jgi:hypothetical protein
LGPYLDKPDLVSTLDTDKEQNAKLRREVQHALGVLVHLKFPELWLGYADGLVGLFSHLRNVLITLLALPNLDNGRVSESDASAMKLNLECRNFHYLRNHFSEEGYTKIKNLNKSVLTAERRKLLENKVTDGIAERLSELRTVVGKILKPETKAVLMLHDTSTTSEQLLTVLRYTRESDAYMTGFDGDKIFKLGDDQLWIQYRIAKEMLACLSAHAEAAEYFRTNVATPEAFHLNESKTIEILSNLTSRKALLETVTGSQEKDATLRWNTCLRKCTWS